MSRTRTNLYSFFLPGMIELAIPFIMSHIVSFAVVSIFKPSQFV